MGDRKANRVKMIGPKGKVSFVSRKAAQSKHLSNIGFMVADDQGPEADQNQHQTRAHAGQA